MPIFTRLKSSTRSLFAAAGTSATLVVVQCAANADPANSSTAQLFDRAYWIAKLSHLTERSLDTGIQVAGVAVVYAMVRTGLNMAVTGIANRLMSREEKLGLSADRAGRLKTLAGLFQSIIGYVTFFVFGVLVFKAIGFDIMPFITTAGVIGLAIGFGAQKLVKDVISGFFIIVDNMFVVGDTITVGAVTGEVQEMAMRVTRLKDPNGRVITISNGDIGTVTNLSRYPVEDFIEIAIAPAFDMKKVTDAINTAGDELFNAKDHDLKACPKLIGITAFSGASVTIRISVTADPKMLPVEQMRVREAVRNALARAEVAPA